MEVDIHGITLQLLPERGIYLPAFKTLMVADTHFGKEATFRRQHVPVPCGATEGTLSAIEAMLAATRPERLVFLGDLFHARSSKADEIMRPLHAFFDRHSKISMLLTLGNHDQRLGELPNAWRFQIEPQYVLGPLQLAHHPQPTQDAASLLCCGHIHPSIRVGSARDQIGKLPCFWLSERQLVLPAIGQFTGTHVIRPSKRDRVWACLPDKVFLVGA